LTHEWRTGDAGLTALDSWLVGHPDTKVVCIDTLAIFSMGRVRSRDIYSDDYESMRRVKALADKHGVCVVAVSHTRKQPANDPLCSLIGTTGVTGAADAVFVLDRSRGSKVATLTITGRDIRDRRMALEWIPNQCRWGLGDAVALLPSGRRRIVEHLRSHGRSTPSDVSVGLKIDRSAANKLMIRMAQDGLLVATDGVYGIPIENDTDVPDVPHDACDPSGSRCPRCHQDHRRRDNDPLRDLRDARDEAVAADTIDLQSRGGC
jgi:hypothetical protein